MSLTVANTNPIFQRAPSVQGVTLTDADTTVPVVLFTSTSTEGSLIDQISVINTDAVDVILQLTITDDAASGDYPLGEVAVPAFAGTNGGVTPSFNILDSTALVLQEGGGRTVPANGTLKVNAKATLTVSESITLVANGGDY